MQWLQLEQLLSQPAMETLQIPVAGLGTGHRASQEFYSPQALVQSWLLKESLSRSLPFYRTRDSKIDTKYCWLREAE